MLIKKPQVHIVSKEIVLATGELVRAFFAVIDSVDEFGAPSREIKLLGIAQIAPEKAPKEEILMLAAPKSRATYSELFIPSYFEAVSPFYTLDYLVNQLARAPSVK